MATRRISSGYVQCLVLSCFFCNTSENRLTLHHTSWFMDIFSLSFFIYFSLYILMKLMNYIVFYCVFPMRHFCRDLSQLAIWCCPNHRSKAYELLTTAGIPEVDAPVPWARKKKVNTQLSWVVNQFGGMDGWMISPFFFGGGYPVTNSDAPKMMHQVEILRSKPPSKLSKLHLRQQILLQRCGRRPVPHKDAELQS